MLVGAGGAPPHAASGEGSYGPAHQSEGTMSLPDWLLLTSALLAGAVVLDVLARRVRLPLTVVLAVAGFLVAWLGDAFGAESPLRGERFEEVVVVVFVFLPLLVMEAALGLSTRDFFANLGPILVLAVVALGVSAALVGLALHLGLGTPSPPPSSSAPSSLPPTPSPSWPSSASWGCRGGC